MAYHLLRKNDHQTSCWSGGETTQVFLYPPTGKYEPGKFDYRISTASVEVEESIFSALPGYNRLLMSLNHPLELTHESLSNTVTKKMKPFEVDAFDGADKTKSVGKCQDFNVIFKPTYVSEMSAVDSIKKRQLLPCIRYFYYLLTDGLMTYTDQEGEHVAKLEAGDCIMVEEGRTISMISIESHQPHQSPAVVEVVVWKNEKSL
ncbi:HutD family protein [Vagococcus bubulae]|nr:HutD family protein [Vagococcus bubulae]